MARLFLDTSAVVKLYVGEPNSALVQNCVHSTDQLLISRLTLLEFRSALYLKVRQGLVDQQAALGVISQFDLDVSQYELLSVSDTILSRAQALLDRFGISNNLRPPDAIQLACALDAHENEPLDTLITTDQDQRAIALASGLTVLP